MRSITSGSANIFAPKMKKTKRLHLQNAILNSMSDILLQIFSMKKEVHITVFFSQGDVALMEWIADITTKSLQYKIAKALIKQKTYSEELVSVVLEKTWKELVHFQRKQKPFTLVITDCQVIKMELLNFTKSCWGISVFGELWKISIFFLIKVMPSSNMHTDVWLSLQRK